MMQHVARPAKTSPPSPLSCRERGSRRHVPRRDAHSDPSFSPLSPREGGAGGVRSFRADAMRLSCAVLAAFALASSASAGELEFRLRFPASRRAEPFTGRTYVMLMARDTPQLAGGPNWFRPEPFFAVDVKDVKPGQVVVIDRKALGYPATLDKLRRGTYTIQAVMDFRPNAATFSRAPGNLYAIDRRPLDFATTGPVELTLDRVVPARPFTESARVKLVDIESKLLTKFHGRPTRLRAGVALPQSYAEDTERRYPVVYEIPGFGGDHFGAFAAIPRGDTSLDGVEVIHVVLDPNCHFGHHVFADSANNGPYGKALIEELIPAIEKRFRAIPRPAARLLTGHSSGGWSSLWLQVTYPDSFGGVWSTAPDPVDFRDFQRIDLYRAGENMFADARGVRRPIARQGTEPVLFYKPFSDMEVIMGHGGQLESFEAVFSERGDDGLPKRLWDRKTGAIDPKVATSWEKYDIRLVLERNWKTLGPKLRGKIHVYMGDLDTFYLEGATRLLGQSLKKLGSDAVVELFAGKDHRTLMEPAMRRRIAREMAATLRAAKVGE
jgi:S-formylglutathione hydrolase FrmB